ncbi:uncharacterized protein [Acropora muricata]|uniref:uncharacterized protein isoform X3 n=1 Tax=Acropora muricata TaxID=159855 RepID=UPI0034E47A77
MSTRGSSFPGPLRPLSQEAIEGSASMIPSGKLKVTLLSCEWGSTKGGISTINRELAIQLAKNDNVEVSMYLPLCSEEDERAAAGFSVYLLKAKRKPGYDPIDWLASIPRDHCMDVVIGHGIHLGRPVPHIRELHADCKWIQVVHTDPEELGMFKDYADPTVKGEKKHQAEVELCALADQVVAVGPKLTEHFARYLRSCGKDQDVINLTPGIFSEFAHINQATTEGGTFCVLVFGRGDSEDFHVKGYDIAAGAVAKLKDEEHSFKLVFVGAPDGEEEKVKERFLEKGILPNQLIVRKAKDREQLANEFYEADLVIMPSRTEGFGLAALEALSAGLPVLVSGNSGIGKALKEVPYGSNCVVNLDFNDKDPMKWAEAIKAVFRKKREVRLKEAILLRQHYAEKYPWQGQCSTLVEKMCQMIKETSTVPDQAIAAVNSEIQRKRSAHPMEATTEKRQRQNADVPENASRTSQILVQQGEARRGASVEDRTERQGVSHTASQGEHRCQEFGDRLVKLLIRPDNLNEEQREVVEKHLTLTVEDYVKFNSNPSIEAFAFHLFNVYESTLVTVGNGSVIIIVECPTLETLEHLWNDYLSGELDKVAERCFVTDKLKKKLNLETTCLKISIKEENYLNCRKAFREPPSTCLVTPPEINLRGPRALEAYNRALTEGRTRVRRIPIMLIGRDRSGKTSLKKSLQGLKFNPSEDSTVGIDVDPSYFKVTTDIWKTGEKDQAANKEEMAASFDHHVARVTIENLREQKLNSEVKTMDKAKDLEGLPTGITHDQVSSSADSFSTARIETEDYSDSPKSPGAAHVVGGSRIFQTTDNYPSPTKARDDTVPSEMIPKGIETLIKKLRDKVDKVDSEDDVYSVLWDFAGQSVYYETHQLFLTPRAIYLLVHDLSRDPMESAQPVKKQGVFGKIEEKSCTKTNLDYLDYWMTSVSSQSSRIEDHDLYSPSISTVLPKTIPPVFLVCTHSDQPFKRNDPSELAINVYGFLKTKSYGEQLVDVVFKVDNTKSGTQEECPEVKRLRESILAVAKELPQTKENIPVKWLKYEKALQAVLDYGHKCITIEHAKRIASEVCKIHEEEEFVTVLNFLHDQRILIHFDDTVELNKLVVLDPQWLIDVFKTVITVKRYDQQERGLNDLWLKLEREGILEERLLRHAWGQIVGEHHTFESLIAIMERFSLLCSWSSSNESNSREYLVPSMLRWYPPQEITKLITSASLPSLFVKFKSGQVPSNLFPRLVVQLLQWGRNEFWSRVDPQLYKSFARIYTAEDKNHSVVLLCHSSMIEVVVHRGNARSPKDDLQADLGISPGDQHDSFEVFCAREVFRQLVLLLECLRKEFCWLKRMEYQAGIICPVCCHKRFVNYCRTHHKQDCEQEECLHFIPESELRKSNHHIICTRSAVAVDNTVYSKAFTAWFASPREETATAAANVGRLSCSRRESEDKSCDLPDNIVESLVSSSYDPKEILYLDQTDVEQATPETTIKDSSQIDVVKPLRDTTPEKTTESEDKSVTLPGNVVESLVSPSCDPKEIVLQLKENLHLDETDLENSTPETKRMIRCFAETAKDSKRIDVVKHLREITPAGTTGPLLPAKLDICSIPVEKMRELTIDLTVTDWQWKVVAERLGLRAKEIAFLDMRYPNPCEAALAFVAQYRGMNVDYLYDVLSECGMPALADTL